MIKFLKSNWREAIALAVIVPLLLVAILALGSKDVSESGPLSATFSLLATLIGGAAKFATALALAWLGLLVTFPEANKFILGDEFDAQWEGQPPKTKLLISLSAAGILAIVAGLCMASA